MRSAVFWLMLAIGTLLLMKLSMLRIFAVALLGSSGLVASIQAHASEQKSLELRHVRGGVYVVEDRYYYKENSVVYIGRDHVTVVGATWAPEIAKELAQEIREVTSKPITEVINTNYHTDRAGGNGYWQSVGAVIISTQMTADAMKAGWDEVVAFTRQGIPSYPELPLVMPSKTFNGDFELQGGLVQAKYLGPSHTDDGIFVYFPAERILYGNCILKQELGNLKYANLSEYPKTLKKLKALQLDFDTVIAGHQDALHEPSLIDHYQTLLRNR